MSAQLEDTQFCESDLKACGIEEVPGVNVQVGQVTAFDVMSLFFLAFLLGVGLSYSVVYLLRTYA